MYRSIFDQSTITKPNGAPNSKGKRKNSYFKELNLASCQYSLKDIKNSLKSPFYRLKKIKNKIIVKNKQKFNETGVLYNLPEKSTIIFS